MTPEEQAAHDAAQALVAANPEELKKQVAALNLENAQRRHREKELADQLAGFESKQKAEAEKAAAEKGEFKTLYEGLKGEHDGATARMVAMEGALNKILEVEIAAIPEKMRGLVPGGDVSAKLEWIAAAKTANLFTGAAGPGVRTPGEPGAEGKMKRSDFDLLPPAKKAEYISKGGKITD